MNKDRFLESLDEALKELEKEGKVIGNPDLKQGFFTSSHQPGIFWQPVEEGRKFECSLCGLIAKNYCTKDNKKIFTCNNCCLKMFKK